MSAKGFALAPEIRNSRSVFIYGAGSAGRRTACILKSQACDLEGFIDTNRDRWGEIFCGKTIYPPSLLEGQKGVLIVSANPFERIASLALDQYGFNGRLFVDYNNSLFFSEKPLTGDFWIKKCHIEERFGIVNQFPFSIVLAAKYREQRSGDAGGAFRLLAEQMIRLNGYVCGAVLENTGIVHHVISNKCEELIRMSGFKPMKSDLGSCLNEAVEILESGHGLLFCGSPCQIAELKKKTGSDPSLVTVDFKCKGLPPQILWKKHYDHLSNEKGDGQIAFSQREMSGWDHTDNLYLLRNSQWSAIENDLYVYAVNRNLNNDIGCSDCAVSKRHCSDLTLSSCERRKNNGVYDNNFGFTHCTINTEKGLRYLSGVLESAEYFGIADGDRCDREESCLPPAALAKINKAYYWNTLEESGKHFDILLAAIWVRNYGSCLNSFCTNHILRQLGYSVLMLNNKFGIGVPEHGYEMPLDQFADFALPKYENSIEYLEACSDINELFDVAVVGAEQVWNYPDILQSKGGVDCYFLAFVSDDKKRLAYSCSFGDAILAPPEEYDDKITDLLKKMQAVSVREASGVDICKRRYGIDAALVLEPALTVNVSVFTDVIGPIDIGKPVIFAYILSPDSEKLEFVHHCELKYHSKAIVVAEQDCSADDKRRNTEYINGCIDGEVIYPTVPEWLCYIRDSKYIITDAYHGTCLSIQFKKRFISIVNRQTERFDVFNDIPGVADHVIEKAVLKDSYELLETDIDYERVEKWLENERERSLEWLRTSLEKCFEK